ncbi:MAG: hypothetical protein WCT02_02250 [Candidatus Paceibacterota bacterium]
MKKIQPLLITIFTTLPLVTFAQTKTLKDLISLVAGYFNDILALLMGAAVVMFVWYVIRYFIMPNEKRTEAAQYIMWALIGFFAILSLWGLVNILIGTFNLQTGSPTRWTDLKSLFPGN